VTHRDRDSSLLVGTSRSSCGFVSASLRSCREPW
jgi:hypothetical protein